MKKILLFALSIIVHSYAYSNEVTPQITTLEDKETLLLDRIMGLKGEKNYVQIKDGQGHALVATGHLLYHRSTENVDFDEAILHLNLAQKYTAAVSLGKLISPKWTSVKSTGSQNCLLLSYFKNKETGSRETDLIHFSAKVESGMYKIETSLISSKTSKDAVLDIFMSDACKGVKDLSDLSQDFSVTKIDFKFINN